MFRRSSVGRPRRCAEEFEGCGLEERLVVMELLVAELSIPVIYESVRLNSVGLMV